MTVLESRTNTDNVTIPVLRMGHRNLEKAIEELLVQFANDYGDYIRPTYVALDEVDERVQVKVDLVLK